MSLITMEELVFRCGAEIACLQKLVGRLESRARTKINWIIVQYSITGLAVIGGKCFQVGVFLEVGVFRSRANTVPHLHTIKK